MPERSRDLSFGQRDAAAILSIDGENGYIEKATAADGKMGVEWGANELESV